MGDSDHNAVEISIKIPKMNQQSRRNVLKELGHKKIDYKILEENKKTILEHYNRKLEEIKIIFPDDDNSSLKNENEIDNLTKKLQNT